MARGRILAFFIDLLRRLYNTLALPCERVMDLKSLNNLAKNTLSSLVCSRATHLTAHQCAIHTLTRKCAIKLHTSVLNISNPIWLDFLV